MPVQGKMRIAQDSVKREYRLPFVPSKAGVKELDSGIPTYGEKKGVDEQVYDELRSAGEILEKILPLPKEKGNRTRSYEPFSVRRCLEMLHLRLNTLLD